MIAKGNLHADGGKLIDYILSAERGERVELGGERGFEFFSDDPREAADLMQRMALLVTNSEKPWFHTQTRLAPGEHLSNEQWEEVVDREEKRLGFTGLPRMWTFHVDEATGERHLHAAWYRVDVENERAVDPGLFKLRLKELSRTLEKEFALHEVSNHRQPHDRAKTADRDEVEESRRLGTDVRTIRTTILDCLQQADNGKAFKAALGAQGYELAAGDRRDCFVVVDQAGGQHALNKKLTGLTLAETRDRLADLDRSQLPGVEQAKELQAERAAQERMKHGRGVEAAGQGIAPSDGPQRGAVAEIKPLGKTAGEIRLAWGVTRGGAQFAEEIENRGLILVYVTAEEAQASERAKAFAKAVGRQNRAMKEGFAVVDQRGTVTRIDQRVTGDQWEEIEKRLGVIDRDSLLSVADAREAMKEANRAAWREQQERERPATAIETKIADALKTTMTGTEFAEALDKAGLTITRTNAADVEALAALRHDDQLAAASGIEMSGRYFARLEIGDLAAVTKSGDVFRLSPHQLDVVEIDQRLADVQPRMASVTEARAFNQLSREETAALWADIRAENTARRVASSEARDAGREFRAAAASVQHAKQETIETAEQAVDSGARAAGGLLGGIASMVDKLFDFLADMIAPPPPPTPEQAERMERAAEERQEQAAMIASAAEQEARFQELQRQMARDDAERQLKEQHDRQYREEHERDR